MDKIKWKLKKLRKSEDSQNYYLEIQKKGVKIKGVLSEENVRQITGFFDNRI